MKLKNRIIRALLSFFSPRPASGAERFLIVSTTGLGDTLWATPAIRSLRHSFPRAYIAVLTTPLGREVLENNPHIDELFLWKKPPLFSFFCLLRTLRQKKFEKILIFHTSQRALLPLCYLLQAPEMIGSEGINKGLDFLLTKKIPQKSLHEIARRIEIVEKAYPNRSEIWSMGARSIDPSLELYVSKKAQESMEEFLKSRAIHSFIPLVGIHPGAKDKFKQWEPASFIEVGKRLKDHLGCQIFVTGNQEERALMEQIAGEIPGAIALTENLPLPLFAALVKRFSLMLSNDTGPMHVAFALRTPTVALFGPTDPKLCGPFAAGNNIVIAKPSTCTPCLRKKCQQPFCLLQISPDEVYEAALNLFYVKK